MATLNEPLFISFILPWSLAPLNEKVPFTLVSVVSVTVTVPVATEFPSSGANQVL